jgi:hypothetical protein
MYHLDQPVDGPLAVGRLQLQLAVMQNCLCPANCEQGAVYIAQGLS